MKRIVMMMCSAIAALLFATNLFAQSHPSTNNRSEQFILDSMRMELDLASIETRHEMYSDSLQHQLDAQSINSDTIEEVSQLFIPFSFFAFIILIIWIINHISYRKQRDRYHIIEKAIDNGQAIPEGLFDEPKKAKKRWTNTLRQAIIFLAIGIGVTIFGNAIDEETITAIAVIPGVIGAGYLLIALIERHEERNKDTKENNESSTVLIESGTQKAEAEE